jgi:TRAP-type uncharacterized transport system substrate-binding protein
LHNDIAVLAAPAGSTITKVGDLFKKRVGLFSAMTANAALLDAILAEYEIAPETVQHIMLSGEDLATIVSQKGVDAILTVGPLRGRSIEIATAALASRTRAPVLIPVDAAEGIAARGPEYQKADIPAGFFRRSPPQPKENVAAISISVRLEARQNLSEEIVTGLTKRLFAMRRSLQNQGERHTVTIVAKGYVWREATYASFSIIARAITGTAWNGPRFFVSGSTRGPRQRGISQKIKIWD